MSAYEEKYKVIPAMLKYGGSFVKGLAEMLILADMTNSHKIKTTWPEHWKQYLSFAEDYGMTLKLRPDIDDENDTTGALCPVCGDKVIIATTNDLKHQTLHCAVCDWSRDWILQKPDGLMLRKDGPVPTPKTYRPIPDVK
jgi:hypothetical protein